MKINRRNLLKAGSAFSTAPMVYSSNSYGDEFTNEPDSDVVKLGFTVVRTGPFADEGQDELNGFELAVEHINGIGDGGMLNTMQPTSLQGNGILGRRVEFVVADTEARPAVAEENARRLIDDEGVTMISGGSSSRVAIALQELALERGIIFMAGLTHSNDTTGVAGVKNGFRHHVNAYMSNIALATHLTEKYSAPRKVYYLSADFNWGQQNETGFREIFESRGWETVDAVTTPLSVTDFTSYLTPVIESGADTLMMSVYGANMVNMLSNADSLGLKDLVMNGNPFVMGIPLFTDLQARGAGSTAEGIYGTGNWHFSLTDAASQAFLSSYGMKHGRPPSAAAHTCYVQTLLYADACERVGTFDPCRVVAALQDHSFSGLGNGDCFYRAADHQCFKSIPIMKGGPGGALTVETQIPQSTVEYSVDNDRFNTSHGECFNGVRSVAVSETSSSVSGDTTSINADTGSGGGGGSLAVAGLAAIGAGLIARRNMNLKNDSYSD